MRKLLVYAVLALVIGACKEDIKQENVVPEGPVTTFYLIRHAEKNRSNPEDPNPALTEAGKARAQKWAEYFQEIPLASIYSTNYTRTKMTVVPISLEKKLPIIHYEPSKIDGPRLVSRHNGTEVLVVGHSNTIPDLVNNLIGENRFEQMDDGDNSSLFIVKIQGAQTTVNVERIEL